jgi:hypothetical protein
MARIVEEWIGKTDDQRAPKRVRDRIRDKYSTCYICGCDFSDGKKVALDHVKALINGGENRESNLRPVHVTCHAVKTAEDVAEKARIAAKRQKHRGIVDVNQTIAGQPFPMTRKRADKLAKRDPKPTAPNNSQLFRAWKAAHSGEVA